MPRLSTHVLDNCSGVPARGMRIELWRLGPGGARQRLVETATDEDGRTAPLLAGEALAVGAYELVFHVGAYFAARSGALPDPPFLDEVPVRFGIADPQGHYHVPLLCSPWAYSTYRGS